MPDPVCSRCPCRPAPPDRRTYSRCRERVRAWIVRRSAARAAAGLCPDCAAPSGPARRCPDCLHAIRVKRAALAKRKETTTDG